MVYIGDEQLNAKVMKTIKYKCTQKAAENEIRIDHDNVAAQANKKESPKRQIESYRPTRIKASMPFVH